MQSLAMVDFSLFRASIGPEAIESKIPYISMFPAKLCNIHLHTMNQQITKKLRREGTIT